MKGQIKSHFYGGVHPSDGTDKLLSSQAPIKYFVPNKVEISMMQATNKICQPVVGKGDKVKLGQVIGVSKGFGQVDIHASVSGTIADIVKRKINTDCFYDTIVIEKDKDFNEESLFNIDKCKEVLNIDSYSKEDIVLAMKDGGIIGMGGAGFPAHIKYETDQKIDTLLINAAECEPYLTCDHKLMLEYSYEIINGVNLMLKAIKADRAIICIEDNKMDAGFLLEEILSKLELSIDVKILPTLYPQGGERQLVQAVIGKEVPANMLPAQIGVIISNVATAKAVHDMVFFKRPLISRCITVTGSVKSPRNYMVPIGTPLRELIHNSGGISSKQDNKIIHGGPMTGECIASNTLANDLEGGVLKTSSGLIVLADEEINESPCIRCGACERVCPAGLSPFKIDFAAIEDDIVTCKRLYATECISCGCCSYVCPAKRELAWRITIAKNEIYNIRSKNGGKDCDK